MTARPPIPLERLVQQVCDDGADYDDGVMGYCSGRLETLTIGERTETILILAFEREEDSPAMDDEDDWGSAEYRFRLIPDEADR